MRGTTATTIEIAPGRRVPSWLVLSLVLVGQFMVVLDASIVNVALPSIQHDLHFTTSGLQWIVNAYTLTFAGFLLLGGRAADLYGRRKVFLVGLTVFTASSLLGGLAQDQAWLVGARALQGLGAAILAPATLTILTATFPEGAARAWALGAWSAVSSAGASAGALFGGILTDFLSWRWILFVNVPVGIVALVAARRYLPESRADMEHRHLDLAGAITVTGGLVAVVYALVRTETFSWGSGEVLLPLAVGVALLGIFIVLQARFSKAPLVPLRIFRSRSVAGGNVVMLMMFGALFGSWYFETLYMQHVLGYSPLQAGLAFLPQTVLIAFGAQVTARLVPKLGPRLLILIGTLVAGAGLAWLAQVTTTTGFVSGLLGPFVLIGLGMGLAVTPIAVAGTAGVPPRDAGLASGLLNTSRTVGASIGLAALATIAASRTVRALSGHVATPAHTASALTAGYTLAFGIAAGLLVATAIVAMATLPSQRAISQAARTAPEVRAPEPESELELEGV
ncbi:MAG TPA: MFS transporter [Acidimicrobiales bacterium]|jgi:EmrB/QacA subfamily drug resistance transporter|nr:MFS transporter [Acidimicrobiales bacterium]